MQAGYGDISAQSTTDLTRITYRCLLLLTLAYCYLPSLTVTYRYLLLLTVAHCYLPLLTVTYRAGGLW